MVEIGPRKFGAAFQGGFRSSRAAGDTTWAYFLGSLALFPFLVRGLDTTLLKDQRSWSFCVRDTLVLRFRLFVWRILLFADAAFVVATFVATCLGYRLELHFVKSSEPFFIAQPLFGRSMLFSRGVCATMFYHSGFVDLPGVGCIDLQRFFPGGSIVVKSLRCFLT